MEQKIAPNYYAKILVLQLLIVLLSGQYALGISNIDQSTKDSLSLKIKSFKNKGLDNSENTAYIDAVLALAKEYRYYNVDSLYNLTRKAQKLLIHADHPKGNYNVYFNYGVYYSDKGAFPKAIENLNKALDIAYNLDDDKLIASALNRLASQYQYGGDYEKSLMNYLKGLDFAKKSQDNDILSIINENIAHLYASQQEYDIALDFYKEVTEINKKLNNPVVTAQTLSNLASIYTEIGDTKQAMFHINQSINTFEQEEVYDWLAYSYSVKGEIYLKEGKEKWALYWLDQSKLLYNNNLDDKRGEIALYNNLSLAYMGTGSDSLATDYALKGLDIAKDIQSKEGQIDCAETLYKIFKEKEDYKRALCYHEIYTSLSDTLAKESNTKSLKLFKTQLKYDQQKKELILENEKKLAKQQNLITLALLVLIVLIAAAIPLYLNQKKLKKLYRELKIQAASLTEREKELESSNTTKDKLFSIVGHDLRGPIGALQGLLEMIISGDLGQQEANRFIRKAKTDVDHVLFTLNNILSWGRTQLNGGNTRPTTTNIYKLAENNLDFLDEMAAAKDIKIINDIAKASNAFIDENQIDLVLRNLISNAIKFTPNNGLITLESEESLNHIQIKIKDTGVGMDNATKEKIFKANTNFTTYGTNNEKGTGLGLSLCKEMIEKNNGKIWVESAPQKGSTFHFTVPKLSENLKKAS